MFALLVSSCADEAVQTGELDQEIIGGIPTAEHPAVGQLLINGYHSCTATLIGCSTVLTAAHCVCDTDDGTCGLRTPTLFFQNAGEFTAAEVIPHPQYGRTENGLLAYDIAVIKLSKPVTGIEPLNIQRTPPQPSPVTIIGYGRTSPTGEDYGIKRKGASNSVVCESEIYGEDDQHHLCFESGNLACQGDSGGPTFMGNGASLEIAGVSSYGYSCQDRSVRAKVATYADWVDETANGDLEEKTCGSVPHLGRNLATTNVVDGILSPSQQSYSEVIDIPEGSTELRIASNGEDRLLDLDMYVGPGEYAGASIHECAATGDGNNGECIILSPEPGLWSIAMVRVSGGGNFQLTVTVLGDGPTGSNDSYEVFGDSGIQSVPAASGLLINDAPSTRGGSAILVTPPANGVASVAEDGSFTYTPTPGFLGMDSFSYKIDDGSYNSPDIDVQLLVATPPGDVIGGCQTSGRGTGLAGLLLFAACALGTRRRKQSVTP